MNQKTPANESSPEIQTVRRIRFGLRSKFLLAFTLVLSGYGLASSIYLLRYFFDDKARYVLFSLHQGAEAMCTKLAHQHSDRGSWLDSLREYDSASGFIFADGSGQVLAANGEAEIKPMSATTAWQLVAKYSDHDKLRNFTVEHRDQNVRFFLSACRLDTVANARPNPAVVPAAGANPTAGADPTQSGVTPTPPAAATPPATREAAPWLLLVADANQALKPAMFLLIQMGGLFLILLLAGFSIFWGLAHSLTKPLKQLTLAAEDLGSGNYTRSLPVKNQDELGVLADSFVILSNRLEKRESELEKTTELANQDPLTGLWNRRYADRRGQEILSLAKRHGRDMSVIYMDADHFKKINDTYGHAAGDDVLRDFARILKTQLRDTDFVARVGGEEFVMILPETNLEGALQAAQKLRQSLKAHNFLGEKQIKMTASLGAASLMSESFDTAQALIEAADKYAYASKTGGRDRISSSLGQIA